MQYAIKTIAGAALCLILSLPSVSKAPQAQVTTVQMKGMRFQPSTVEIPVGGTVRWVNETKNMHDVVAEDGSFKSSSIGQGGVYVYRFDKPGTYKYYCRPHKSMGMKGTIIVK